MVGRLIRAFVVLCFHLSLSPLVSAQEVLLPLQSVPSSPKVQKTSVEAVTLPFFDDFSHGAISYFLPSGGATVDDGAGLLPPTVGVVTLDAIDQSGHLYPHASIAPFTADTLTSLPIKLDGFSPADSLILSFYYLPGGGEGNLWERVGDTPEAEDSLFVDFFRPSDSMWVTVWSRGGTEVDSLVNTTGVHWQYVTIEVDDNAYFDSTFQFRFRNHCSLTVTTKPGMTGNCDFWHLDYILLDRGRSLLSSPVFRDVAFSSPAPSALASYRAMPARQYRSAEMSTAFNMRIVNLFGSDLATQYTYAIVDASGDTLYQYDGGYENAPPFLPTEACQQSPAHATPAVGYAFPESSQPASYTIVHMVREGVGGDIHRENDTVRFQQLLTDYYAYDDGTAENGYGLTTTASHLFLACRFDLNETDTLTALDLYFNRTINGENEQVPFLITIWQADNGKPGTVLYRDQSSRHPVPENLNTFHRYLLDTAVVVSGSLFVGFEQTNNYYINLGFDRSLNSADRIFYLTGTEWQQSILSGSLMLRPCFGTAATVGISPAQKPAIHVFPNPTNDKVYIEGLPEGSRIELYDAAGRRVHTDLHPQISTSNYPNGLYLLRCITPDGTAHTTKIVIQN